MQELDRVSGLRLTIYTFVMKLLEITRKIPELVGHEGEAARVTPKTVSKTLFFVTARIYFNALKITRDCGGKTNQEDIESMIKKQRAMYKKDDRVSEKTTEKKMYRQLELVLNEVRQSKHKNDRIQKLILQAEKAQKELKSKFDNEERKENSKTQKTI